MIINMPDADVRMFLARAQLVLIREREISQMLVDDGLLDAIFHLPLAFFLDKHRQYLHIITKKLCRPARIKDLRPVVLQHNKKRFNIKIGISQGRNIG